MEAAESRGSRGIKRSASHMDLEELPEEQKENECQDRKVKKPMTQYEVNISWQLICVVKFIYSEKATKFCEIFPLLLTVCTVVKSKGKILQNFVAFSEYINFPYT